MSRAIELASTRAPVALDGVRAERIDGNGDPGTIWYRISCPCGGTCGAILSEHDPAEDFWIDPIVFRCARCDRSWTVFDSQRHGYDAVLNNLSGYEPRTRDEQLPCSACGGFSHGLVAAYRYDIDDLEWWSEEELRQMPDLFTSVGFEPACADCGAKRWIGDWECA